MQSNCCFPQLTISARLLSIASSVLLIYYYTTDFMSLGRKKIHRKERKLTELKVVFESIDGNATSRYVALKFVVHMTFKVTIVPSKSLNIRCSCCFMYMWCQSPVSGTVWRTKQKRKHEDTGLLPVVFTSLVFLNKSCRCILSHSNKVTQLYVTDFNDSTTTFFKLCVYTDNVF